MNTSKLFIICVALIGLFVNVNTLQCYECIDCHDATALTDDNVVTCGGTEDPTTTPAGGTEDPTTTPAGGTEGPTTTPAGGTEDPTTTPATVTEAPTTTPATVTEAPTTTPATVTEAPTTTPATVTEAPTTTPATVTEAPTTTPATVTEAPTTTPATVTEAPTTTPATVTEAPTTTPATVTEAPTTTPAPTTTVVPPLVVLPVALRVRRHILQNIDNLDNGCKCNGKYCVCDDDTQGTEVKRASSYTDNEITYVCTKIVTNLNGTDVTSRGCAPSHIGEQEFCVALDATDCHTCDTDKCNSGNIVQQSIAILLVLLIVGLFSK